MKRPWTVLPLFAACLLAGLPLRADDDRITVLPQDAAAPITVVGEILDFTGREIRIRLKTGAGQQYYRADEVLNVETFHLSTHRKGLEAFEAGRITEAAAAFQAALQEEPREWVRRELRAWIVRCAARQEQWSTAAEQFLQIVKSDPASRHWGLAPLVWAPLAVGEPLRNAARTWIADPSPAARLLGASLLLLHPTYGEAAETELRRLARDSDVYLSNLAATQLWRLRLQANDMTENEFASWRDRIERMPEIIRGGPYYLLGAAHFRRSEFELAAAAWLWLPLVHSENEPLAARACLDAADALQRLGRDTEAATLFEEVAVRYAWSTSAAEARRRLPEAAAGSSS